MREKGIDYFENSRRATIAQQRYAIANPQGFKDYGENIWGLTASDGPAGECELPLNRQVEYPSAFLLNRICVGLTIIIVIRCVNLEREDLFSIYNLIVLRTISYVGIRYDQSIFLTDVNPAVRTKINGGRQNETDVFEFAIFEDKICALMSVHEDVWPQCRIIIGYGS